MTNQYRINENVLLKIDKNLSEINNFWKYENVQYLSTKFETSSNENIDKTVWGFNEFESRLNKVFNGNRLIDYNVLTLVENQKTINASLLLKQGFSWNNIFGILVVVKSMSDKILISQIYDINDFRINFDDSKELISGSFWTSNVNFSIPDLNENMMISVESILFSDIDSIGSTIGKIHNYPLNNTSFEPLIGEEPTPDYIQTSVTILNNQYLKIVPTTSELNKTLKQSIIDYFTLTDKVITINVEHVIKYGNDTFGYKTIRISNEDDKFAQLIIGLDFTIFQSTIINIFVSTEIVCNNKLMKREQQILFDFTDILNPIINNLILSPTTVFPVEVKNIQNVTNTIIQTNTENKIIPIYQSVFVEIVVKDFLFENKNVSFTNILIDSYLIIKTPEEQFILSKRTNSDIIYYDLSQVIKPTTPVEYQIVDAVDKKIIQKGMITI